MSGANLTPAPLAKYFGYDADMMLDLSRSLYSLAEWTQILDNELAAGRPVFYSGSSTDGGHQFICDGSDGQGLYHINWGWGGYQNGYFDVTMYVNGGLIPTFLLYKGLGLTNSFWVYVIPGMVSAFNMLVIRTYMNGIPDSLEESAQLDGAGYTTIFLKIYSPLCKPVYATVALFVAVGQWNSWFDAMLYNRMNGKLTTLQYELMKLLSSVTNQGNNVEAMKNAVGTVTPTSVRAAATIITMLPIICINEFF